MMTAMTAGLLAAQMLATTGDTIRLEVGAKDVNGLVYAPHAARVRVWAGPGESTLRSEWTNVLTLGDSAGRRVQRWVTRGRQITAAGDTVRWELRQTYDAVTLAPYGITRTTSTGVRSSYRIDGKRVTGTRQASASAPVERVDYILERPGFVASASDLVPLAVGLRKGMVMTAPMWAAGTPASELRVFDVLDSVEVNVEGAKMQAWKVEERRLADRRLLATWYLSGKAPYMVYGEAPGPNGVTLRYTEVSIDPPEP